MKYKVGDKVKIRTWTDMEKEYGLDGNGTISPPGDYYFSKTREGHINKKCPDRILTISHVFSNRYEMTELPSCGWNDSMIECLVEAHVEPEPIHSRFEILDI